MTLDELQNTVLQWQKEQSDVRTVFFIATQRENDDQFSFTSAIMGRTCTLIYSVYKAMKSVGSVRHVIVAGIKLYKKRIRKQNPSDPNVQHKEIKNYES